MTMRTQTMPDWAVAAQLAEGPTYGGTRRGTGRIAIRPTPRRRTFQDFVPDYAQAAGVSRLPSRAAAVAPRPAIQNTVPDYVQAARMAATRAAVPVEEAPFAPIRPTMPPVPGPIDQGLIPPERGEDVMPDVMPRLPMSPYPFPLEPLPMPPYAGPFPNWPNQLMPYPPFAPPQGEIPRGAPPQWEIPIPIWPRGAPQQHLWQQVAEVLWTGSVISTGSPVWLVLV
jgi:hypothetical protein